MRPRGSRRRATLYLAVAALLVAFVGLRAARTPAGPAIPPIAPAGFTLQTIARVPGARELVLAPNGDLLIGTNSRDVDIVRDAEGTPSSPEPFARVDDAPAAGVALGPDALYIGSQFGIWKVPYHPGDAHARDVPVEIAKVRTGGRGGHSTTSIAFARDTLYASVGSSCNVCTETDPTRASVQRLAPDGGGMQPVATHIRNAIALAIDPATGALWAGVAGQDELPHGHPYEIFDPVTLHGGVADYGWPVCYEDRVAARGDADCSHQTVARVVFPAYETPIGAAFYPEEQAGRYAFPARFRGGAFVALHGSWHQPPVPPRVVFVPLHGDVPAVPVDWNDPSKQWIEFLGGFQLADGSRSGRPTGVAVGQDGSVFVADDGAGAIYRIRPATR